MGKIRFGPAGVPINCNGSSSLEGVKCCYELGLEAMELQFGMGVRLGKEMANKIKESSEKLNISISCHAPYFVNLCSRDKKKFEISSRNILQSAKAIYESGGKVFVFHPGFYQGLSKEEAYKNAYLNLKKIKEKTDEISTSLVFGAETVGKKSSFGGLEEVLKLSQELDFVKPVIDFSHLHARGDFLLKSKEDYLKLFSKIEKLLPEYTKNMHCHFSEINYSEKGELNHLVLGSNHEPPFEPLMKILYENGYSGTIICETPNLDIDALKMKKYYENLFKKAKK
ncbi:MAG: TIM barrel protein [Candidatus ainarchaeum sp.]|nr:TIM barrel protein [Candidatus ainarchaeum sp.]